ncbi:MAG: aspartate aminotransferase family protein [Clostridia bacterium]|nr:aspartate aminotransferase family protein [Clostridia bacterium]
MANKDVIEKDKSYIAHTYNRFNVALKTGYGSRVIDFDGKSYIDFGSGIGTNALGFCNEQWLEAVISQAQQLQHTSNLFYTLPDAKLAEMLCKITGYSNVFFGNSGAEANEGAIKIARKHGIETKGKNCNKIITLKNSFHGRTVTTLSATGQDVFHQHFFPFTEGFLYVAANDIQELYNAIDNTVCAVMIEFVQGEGGVIALSKEYVKAIENICKEKNILLIADEVQTGIGRTGTFLCCEQYEVFPNIITLAKGLGGGLPIGAILSDETVKDVLQAGHHGSTFGGNPVVCAGAAAVLRQIANSDSLSDIRQKADYFRRELLEIPEIIEISGLGLMIGISLSEELNAAEIAADCIDNGLLILTAKNKLRILPPLNITYDEINEGIHILKAVLDGKK